MTTVELSYQGQPYPYWTEYEVETDLRSPTGSFRLGVVVPLWGGVVPVTPGGVCELKWDGTTFLSGRVDEVVSTADAENHRVEVSGRDWGAALVDASADPAWTWTNQSLSAIASQITDHVEISGILLDSDATLPSAKVEPGESCWDVLTRLAQAEGMRVWWEADGTLHLGQYITSGNPVGELRRRQPPNGSGNNVLSATVKWSTADAWSEVTVLGGYDDDTGHATFKGVWSDATYPYFRPRVEVDDSVNSQATADARAAALGSQAKASQFEVVCRVQGHGPVSGQIWAVNTLVQMEDDVANLHRQYVIVAVRLSSSVDQGTTAELTLAAPEDFAHV